MPKKHNRHPFQCPCCKALNGDQITLGTSAFIASCSQSSNDHDGADKSINQGKPRQAPRDFARFLSALFCFFANGFMTRAVGIWLNIAELLWRIMMIYILPLLCKFRAASIKFHLHNNSGRLVELRDRGSPNGLSWLNEEESLWSTGLPWLKGLEEGYSFDVLLNCRQQLECRQQLILQHSPFVLL